MAQPDLNLQEFQVDGYVEATACIGDTLYAVTVDSIYKCINNKFESYFSDIDCICVAIAPGAGFLVYSDGAGRLHKILTDGSADVLFEKPGAWIDTLAIHSDGSIAFSYGRTVSVLVSNGQDYHFHLEHAAHGIAWAPKGRRLAVATYNAVHLYWIRSETNPVKLEWKGAHLDVVFSPDNRYVISSMQENALHGWNLSDNTHMRMSGYPGKVQSWDWSAKGRWLATAGAQAAVLWPFQKKLGPQGQQPLQLGPRDVKVCCVACHPKDEVIACGYEDGMVLCIRIEDGSEALLWRGQGNPISHMSWDNKGKVLYIGDTEGSVAILSF